MALNKKQQAELNKRVSSAYEKAFDNGVAYVEFKKGEPVALVAKFHSYDDYGCGSFTDLPLTGEYRDINFDEDFSSLEDAEFDAYIAKRFDGEIYQHN